MRLPSFTGIEFQPLHRTLPCRNTHPSKTGLNGARGGQFVVWVVLNADRVAELMPSLKWAMPDKGTCCGLPPPLSLTETAPLNVPGAPSFGGNGQEKPDFLQAARFSSKYFLKLSGRISNDGLKVIDQVSLVEIAEFQCHLRKIRTLSRPEAFYCLVQAVTPDHPLRTHARYKSVA